MGKPVKPTALKLLHGYQKSRIPKGEPIPAAGAVEPPAHLHAQLALSGISSHPT